MSPVVRAKDFQNCKTTWQATHLFEVMQGEVDVLGFGEENPIDTRLGHALRPAEEKPICFVKTDTWWLEAKQGALAAGQQRGCIRISVS